MGRGLRHSLHHEQSADCSTRFGARMQVFLGGAMVLNAPV